MQFLESLSKYDAMSHSQFLTNVAFFDPFTLANDSINHLINACFSSHTDNKNTTLFVDYAPIRHKKQRNVPFSLPQCSSSPSSSFPLFLLFRLLFPLRILRIGFCLTLVFPTSSPLTTTFPMSETPLRSHTTRETLRLMDTPLTLLSTRIRVIWNVWNKKDTVQSSSEHSIRLVMASLMEMFWIPSTMHMAVGYQCMLSRSPRYSSWHRFGSLHHSTYGIF